MGSGLGVTDMLPDEVGNVLVHEGVLGYAQVYSETPQSVRAEDIGNGRLALRQGTAASKDCQATSRTPPTALCAGSCGSPGRRSGRLTPHPSLTWSQTGSPSLWSELTQYRITNGWMKGTRSEVPRTGRAVLMRGVFLAAVVACPIKPKPSAESADRPWWKVFPWSRLLVSCRYPPTAGIMRTKTPEFRLSCLGRESPGFSTASRQKTAASIEL